eukprot:11366430-Karenia_brevis.AAC.1
MQIFVKTAHGKTFPLDAGASDTITNLRVHAGVQTDKDTFLAQEKVPRPSGTFDAPSGCAESEFVQ